MGFINWIKNFTSTKKDEKPKNNINFVAIDFETANTDLSSPCAVGIVSVTGGKIVEKKSYLIRPKRMRFYKENIKIHGITERDVEKQPEFDEVWDIFGKTLEENLVIAHNATFDMNVLSQTLHLYNIQHNEFQYSCTKKIAQKVWPKWDQYRLDYISQQIGIKLAKHHDPLYDAVGCAEIAIHACHEENVDSMEELLEKLEIELQITSYEKIKASIEKKKKRNSKKYGPKVKISEIEPTVSNYDRNHPCYYRCFCFTGNLKNLSREEAMQAVVDLGGHLSAKITYRTDFLVIGSTEKKTAKQKNAESAIEQGRDIKIIMEEEFLKMIGFIP